jgi:hypothetical protein
MQNYSGFVGFLLTSFTTAGLATGAGFAAGAGLAVATGAGLGAGAAFTGAGASRCISHFEMAGANSFCERDPTNTPI